MQFKLLCLLFTDEADWAACINKTFGLQSINLDCCCRFPQTGWSCSSYGGQRGICFLSYSSCRGIVLLLDWLASTCFRIVSDFSAVVAYCISSRTLWSDVTWTFTKVAFSCCWCCSIEIRLGWLLGTGELHLEMECMWHCRQMNFYVLGLGFSLGWKLLPVWVLHFLGVVVI